MAAHHDYWSKDSGVNLFPKDQSGRIRLWDTELISSICLHPTGKSHGLGTPSCHLRAPSNQTQIFNTYSSIKISSFSPLLLSDIPQQVRGSPPAAGNFLNNGKLLRLEIMKSQDHKMQWKSHIILARTRTRELMLSKPKTRVSVIIYWSDDILNLVDIFNFSTERIAVHSYREALQTKYHNSLKLMHLKILVDFKKL